MDGGLTLGQIEALYELHVERQLEEYKFQAALHGAELGGKGKRKEPSSKSDNNAPMFKDPSEYEDMTEEQRKKLTEEMLKGHKQQVGGFSDLGS